MPSSSSSSNSNITTEVKDEKGEEELLKRKMELEMVGKKRKLKRKLVVDVFDLFVPGLVVGWIRTSTAWVGSATVVSSWIALGDIWEEMGDKER